MIADLQNPAFTDSSAAREALEAVRWPDGPVCPIQEDGSKKAYAFSK